MVKMAAKFSLVILFALVIHTAPCTMQSCVATPHAMGKCMLLGQRVRKEGCLELKAEETVV